MKKEKTGVFIERAAKLDVKGIRAICGTDEEYSEYVKREIITKKNLKNGNKFRNRRKNNNHS